MTDDARLASELAQAAGALLLAVRAENAGIDPGELKDLGDRSAQELLSARLATARPEDCVLSEEAVDDRRRLTASRVWIIDPLDGTREFAEGRSDWAVHVALWEGGSLVAAAVALPGIDTVLCTEPAPVVPARRPGAGALRMAVSRTRPPANGANDSRTNDDSGTLQIASVDRYPVCFASRNAASVSAVSPDCEIDTNSVLRGTTGSR